MSTGTNKSFHQGLRAIVQRYGIEVSRDTRKLEALLLDYCGGQKREIFLVVGAARLGIVDRLIDLRGSSPSSTTLLGLQRQMERQMGLSETAAQTSLESWCWALDLPIPRQAPAVSDASDVPPPDPPTHVKAQPRRPRLGIRSRLQALDQALKRAPWRYLPGFRTGRWWKQLTAVAIYLFGFVGVGEAIALRRSDILSYVVIYIAVALLAPYGWSWYRSHKHIQPPRSTTRDRQVLFAHLIYSCFCAAGLLAFAFIGSQNLAQVSTSGPDDPTHAKTTGIPTNVVVAATTSQVASPLGSKLNGQLKAVENVDPRPPAAGGLPPIWIVYEAGQTPPPQFGWIRNIAIAVNGDTGQQLSVDSISQVAPFSRLGRSGAWLYLGFGFDASTLQAFGIVQAVYLAAIYLRYWLRRQRHVAQGYRRALLTLSIWLVVLVILVLLLPQVIFFGPLIGYMGGLGDPVARGVFEVVPALELIAPILATRLLPKQRRGMFP
jgi:hypothetical protein